MSVKNGLSTVQFRTETVKIQLHEHHLELAITHYEFEDNLPLEGQSMARTLLAVHGKLNQQMGDSDVHTCEVKFQTHRH